MQNRRWVRWMVLLGVMAAPWGSVALAQETGETVHLSGTFGEDLYVAGRTVDVVGEVEGDLLAAGGRVRIGGRVKDDLAAAGGEVTVTGEVGDDVRAAGGIVTLGGRIRGDAVAAGGTVRLEPGGTVGGKAWLAGGTVEVRGSVGRWLRAVGRTIRIAGEVRGDVSLAAQRIEILPSARIEGNLTYRSLQAARIDPGAQIQGKVTRLPIEFAEQASRVGRGVLWAVRLALLLGLAIAGIVLVLLFPNGAVAAARTVGSDPWTSLLVGFALLVATPIAAVLLMLTLLSIPLGLAILALYVVLLLIGFLAAAIFLGDLGVRRYRHEPSAGGNVLRLLAGLAVLGLLRLISYAGPAALVLALLVGMGAWSVYGYRVYSRARP